MEDNANYKNAVDILSTISILKESFSVTEIELFVKLTNFQRYKAKVKIICQSEPAISIICLITGEARVISNDYQLAILREGDIFGESMFSQECIRTANVIASTDVSAIIFTVEDYERLTRISPNIALKYKLFFEAIYKYHKRKDDKFFSVDSTKYLALIAHNEMKSSLVEFVKEHIKLITKFPLVATGTTGLLLHQATGVVLSRKVKSGPLGGDQAIGSMISTDNISGVLFFRDPLSPHPHHADIEALSRLCDVYQVPLATNPSTAKAILLYLDNTPLEGKHNFSLALTKYQENQSRIVQGGVTSSLKPLGDSDYPDIHSVKN